VDDIRQCQATDPTLTNVRNEAGEEESNVRVGFYYHDGLLYRKWRPAGPSEGGCKNLYTISVTPELQTNGIVCGSWLATWGPRIASYNIISSQEFSLM